MNEPTLATRENMRRFEAANPGQTIDTPDGEVRIEPRRCSALDLATGATYSASAGDYFNLPENEPLRGEDGEPLILALKRCEYVDALTGETL
jgi:hypothetical protein